MSELMEEPEGFENESEEDEIMSPPHREQDDDDEREDGESLPPE